jgi:hypothetical protein
VHHLACLDPFELETPLVAVNETSIHVCASDRD